MYNLIKALFNKVTKTDFKPLLRTILNNQTFYDFCRSKGVELNENQSNWFTNCEKNAINFICASRQSGKTKFLTLYAEWLADVKGQTVLIVSCNFRAGPRFSDNFKNYQRVDHWSGAYIHKAPLGNHYDVILFDEMAYQSSVFETFFKGAEYKDVPKMVAISSSKPGSLFNEMILTLPAYLPGINITISRHLPSEEWEKYLDERSYDVEYKCALT